MRPLVALVALLACLFAGTPAAAPQVDGILPYEGLASAFRQRYGIEDASPEGFDLEGLLERKFVHVRLGGLEVYHPAASLAEDKENGKTFKHLAQQLIEMQLVWLDNLDPLKGELKPVRTDLKTLRTWVKGWSVVKLGKAEKEGKTDVYELLKAKQKVVDAGQRAADAMATGAGLGVPDLEPAHGRLVFLPTRREFAEFTGFGGWIAEPHNQPLYWHDSLAVWTEVRVRDLRGLAMEFAAADRKSTDYWSGASMNDRERTGLEQHIVQRGAYALLAATLGEDLDPVFASGMAMNLVIDMYGEDNTRSEGDPKGQSVPPFEVFVPGGNPSGGELPGPNLDGRYRENKGADRFVRILYQAQKQGANDARDKRSKLVNMLLVADDDVERYSVKAPFLGEAAKAIEPPPKRFESDYLEFFRAYKTAFVHWLREKAGKSSKDTSLRFATLLQELAKNRGQKTFEQLVPALYDAQSLADVEISEDALEGRFLRWLQKQN